MIVRWKDAHGQQCSMVVDGPVVIETDSGKCLKVRTPGHSVAEGPYGLTGSHDPQIISVFEEGV